MPGLGSLARSIRPGANTRRAMVYITELDENDAIAIGGYYPPSHALQYYPETITDSKQVNYSPKEIPGASLPLYQWVNSGERTISFTAVFTSDTDHYLAREAEGADEDVSAALLFRARKHNEMTKASGVGGRNVFIPGALAWLRRFLYPRYGSVTEAGTALTMPPRKVLLSLPGTFISMNGGAGGFSSVGGIYAIMTQCEISYTALFPSGNPRIAEVQLVFAEVAQVGGRVRFPGVTADLDRDVSEAYARGTSVGSSIAS
jgi:hypothetical protein